MCLVGIVKSYFLGFSISKLINHEVFTILIIISKISNINMSFIILGQIFPVAPLAEQVAIVKRVEALMSSSRLLAAETAHTRTHVDHLLQAVLKEAFSKET